MPSSYTQNFYHAVFSTKGRVEVVTPEIEERLHSFLGGIAKDLGCVPCAINGMPDHIHLLLRYPADLAHSDMLRHLKSRSSAWIHRTFPAMKKFSWQEGYGGFTVSKSQAERVTAYIRGQKKHHETLTFHDELVKLFKWHGIEFDEADVFR